MMWTIWDYSRNLIGHARFFAYLCVELKRNIDSLQALPVLPGRNALHPEEETSESSRVGIVDSFGNLVDTQGCAFKQPDGLHQQHSVDVLYDGSSGDLPDSTGEIGGRDVQGIGIEFNTVFPDKMLRKQIHESSPILAQYGLATANSISPSRPMTVCRAGINWPTNGRRKQKRSGTRLKKF